MRRLARPAAAAPRGMMPALLRDAVARAAHGGLAGLPGPGAARLLDYLTALVTALPPDDRSVLLALIARGDLARAARSWCCGRNAPKAHARLDAAWRAALARERLPFVPLPALDWPALP
ncbi:hypothetical protein tb265_20190 [Gemmatimonadetes bacterium T265]|nr:hypothetical protein tb265_20190 [Gemmatimonadetes bacterium T265]